MHFPSELGLSGLKRVRSKNESFSKFRPLSNKPKNDIFQVSEQKLNFFENDNYVSEQTKLGQMSIKLNRTHR